MYQILLYGVHFEIAHPPRVFPTHVQEEPVETQDFKRITNHFREIYKIYLKWTKQNRKTSTRNRLDLETLGSWPTMPKNFPGTVPNICMLSLWTDETNK